MDKEIRYLGSKPEIRKTDEEGKESRTVEGYALLFDKESRVLGEGFGFPGFIEKIDKRALEGADMSDVKARTHHKDTHILARTKAGTLKLEIDEKGLKYTFEAPNTTAGNDLLEDIRLKNITDSSFAFNVKEDEWEDRGKDEPAIRTLKKFKIIHDVAPVVDPAYEGTKVDMRAYEAFRKKSHEKRIYNAKQKLELIRLKSAANNY